jgi:senataxin
MADEDALDRAWEEFNALNHDVHLLCPQVDDADHENYDNLEEPGEVGVEVKKQRIEDAKHRIDLTYHISYYLGFSQDDEQVQQRVSQWQERVKSFLTSCHSCVRRWHQHRKHFLNQLTE